MKRLGLFLVAILAGLWVGIRYSQGPAGDPIPASPGQADRARAYLAENLAPLPEGWEWDLFAPKIGVALEVGRVSPPDPIGTILFVPGYTAPLDMYAAEYARFVDAGYAVAAISYRGQGRSEREGPDPQMGWVTDYAVLAEDLARFAGTLEGPVGVFAMSKGGHITLRMVQAHPDLVQAVALSAPMVAIKTDPFPEDVARGLARGFTAVGLGDTYALGRGPWDDAALFDDPARLAEGGICARDPARAHLREALMLLEPDLRVGGPSARWVAATFDSMATLRGNAEAITVPVWMATAGADQVVQTEAASRVCARMGDCTERRFADAQHCLIEDAAETREAVMAEAIAFFDQHLGGDAVE